MKKINVGDIVKANVDHPRFPKYYDVTNEYALCKVIDYDRIYNQITVEVIYHTEKLYCIGRKYTVTPDYFDLVIPVKKTSVKEMTVAEIEKELGYSVKVVKE